MFKEHSSTSSTKKSNAGSMIFQLPSIVPERNATCNGKVKWLDFRTNLGAQKWTYEEGPFLNFARLVCGDSAICFFNGLFPGAVLHASDACPHSRTCICNLGVAPLML